LFESHNWLATIPNCRQSKKSKKKTGCINDNCNGIAIEVPPIPLEDQIVPLMYEDKPIDHQAHLKIIEEGSDLPQKNFPGLTSTQHCCCPPSATGPSIPVSPSKHNWQCPGGGRPFLLIVD